MELSTIQDKIYEIRSQKVMLSQDLAALYEVETKVLNQAVARNSNQSCPKHKNSFIFAKNILTNGRYFNIGRDLT